jgi:signal transduction histidine kinase
MKAESSGTLAQTLDALWLEQQNTVALHFFAARPWIVLPSACVAGLLLFSAGVGVWQLGALCVVFAGLSAFFFWEASAPRQRVLAPRSWCVCLLSALLGMAALCTLSGGLDSPFVPMLIVPTAVTFVTFGRHWLSAFALASAIITLLPVLPLGRWLTAFAPIGSPEKEWITALSVSTALVLLKIALTGAVEGARATAEALDRMRTQTLEDAELRSRTLDTLGARVAHEIKNPLTAISGLTQLLAKGCSEPQARRRFAVIAGEIERIEGILHDYLTFSRPLSEMQTCPVNLRELAQDVVAVMEGSARGRGVRVRCAGPSVEAWVDPRLVKQALLNLVKNAVEATPPGRRVLVSVRQRASGAELEVQDDGCGMDSATLARLGRAFFTQRRGGTGLGVTLARAIARQHNGDLEFTSQPGLGTTARLSLEHQRPN